MQKPNAHSSRSEPTSKPEAERLRLAQQFFRFALVGVVGTFVHYSVMAVLLEGYGLNPLPASAVGFVSSAFASYWLNHKFTFAGTRLHHKALPRFLVVGIVGLGINTVVVGTLSGLAGIHWIFAQAAATTVVLVWNFAANRKWTFAPNDSTDLS